MENWPQTAPCGIRTALQSQWSWPALDIQGRTRKAWRSQVGMTHLEWRQNKIILTMRTVVCLPFDSRCVIIIYCWDTYKNVFYLSLLLKLDSQLGLFLLRPIPGSGHGAADFPCRYSPEGWGRSGLHRRTGAYSHSSQFIPGSSPGIGQ